MPPEYAAFKLVFDEARAICNRILENTAVFKDKKQTVEFLEGLGYAL